MKSGFRRFAVRGGVAGLFAASAVASTPTFTLKLGGIKKPGQDEVIFRQIFGFGNECDPDHDPCPEAAGPGSECVPTELFTGFFVNRCSPIQGIVPLLCEGGGTPGQPCEDNADCVPGACTGSFVEPGDQVMLEVFLSGWDDDPLDGICTDGVNTCIIGGPLCPRKHCNLSDMACDPGDCPGGEICLLDECLPSPLLGVCQWTPDRDTFAGDSGNPAASLYLATISCTEDDGCRHGPLNIAQCTCGDATCDVEECSPEASAYIETRFDALCMFTPLCIARVSVIDLTYMVALAWGLEDAQKEYYVGTLWLQVPNQGTGTYILDMIHDPGFTSVLNDKGEFFPSVSVNTLEVKIANPCISSEGNLDWASSVPPCGMLDARQALDVHDGAILQGIDTIVVNGDAGLGAVCFSLCETETEGPANDIASVIEDPAGAYTIRLDRRITPGAVTSITFCGAHESTGTFASLPGDTNADGVSNADDITELIECCLNKSCTRAHGEYSCDIDHSGSNTAADVLRLLDLLSGAGAFLQAWDGEQLTAGGCP